MVERVKTFWATIFIAGDFEMAKQSCREFCMNGFCVTVEPTTYVYTCGAEEGVRVGLINYPKFPADIDDIANKAWLLAEKLKHDLCQRSFTVMTPEETIHHQDEAKEGDYKPYDN